MRHGKKINHLGRTASHRKALMANMAASLIISDKKRIITTLAKAKALRVYVEPLITRSKSNTTHSRRTVFAYLQNKDAVSSLFGEVAAKVADRPGGYTRILKLGPRKGDNAEMALIELVDFNQFITDGGKKKTTRRRKKTTTAAPKAEAKPAKEKKETKPADETPAVDTPAVENQQEGGSEEQA